MEYITSEQLKLRLRALTILDMALTSEDWLRLMSAGREGDLIWHIFDNGGGDRMWIYIKGSSIVIKGFDHESELNQLAAAIPNFGFFEKTFRGMPSVLIRLFEQDELDETTFCLWTTDGGDTWNENPAENSDGGKGWLMGYLTDDAKEFCQWAEDYYGKKLPSDITEKLVREGRLSPDELKALGASDEAVQEIQGYEEIWA